MTTRARPVSHLTEHAKHYMGTYSPIRAETIYAEFKVDADDNIVEVKEIWQE